MSLHLYNTKSRSVEEFTPLHNNTVTMYACGPTVYDFTHIGHIRKYINDDILKRTLLMLGYDVTHVMNITDVGHLTGDTDESGEDKLEKGAKRENRSVWEIASFYSDYFHQTMRAVNVLPPTHEPKATDHVPTMVALIEKLLENGFAYETPHAIYFDTTKDPSYGMLSGQKLSEKEVAVRDDVVIDPDKRHPADFSLWFKRVGKFADHVMYWDSPKGIQGDGFPGWHIECSAMSMEYLGETMDIHTGGIDHIPVHHENEIAQSECATGKEFARFWVHYEFLTVNGVKMSKSLQNFYTLDDIAVRQIDPLAMRMLVMQTHYRKSINFTWESLKSANLLVKKLQRFASHQSTVGTAVSSYITSFTDALCEDLNTARALAVLWELYNDTDISDRDKWTTMLAFDEVLGFDLKAVTSFIISPEATALLEERSIARKNKDFATSDRLRVSLEGLGYEVLDTAEGTTLY